MRLSTSRKSRACKKCKGLITCGDLYYPQRRKKAICFCCGYKLKFKLVGIIMANKQANAAQKQWMNDITEWAKNNIQILYGDEWSNKPIQRHHVLGRSAKHNKVAIGHEFILPVPFELHDVSSNHDHNVTHRKNSFVREFGSQRGLFEKMCLSMEDHGYKTPELKTYLAIMSTAA